MVRVRNWVASAKHPKTGRLYTEKTRWKVIYAFEK